MAQPRLKTFLFIVLSLGCLFASCGKKEKQISKIDQAREALNNRQYATATIILRELFEKNPDSGEIKVLLASALTGSAGFDFTQSFPAFEQALKMTNSDSSIPVSDDNIKASAPDKPANPNELSLYLEKTLRGMSGEIIKFLNILKFIPFVDKGDGRDKIKEAILVLEGISEEDKYYTTSVGYSLLLNSIQFLNLLRDIFGEFTNKDSGSIRFKRESELICNVKYSEVVDNSISSTYYMRNAVKNLNQIAVTKAQVATIIKKLVQLTESFENVVQASRTDLRFIGDALEEIGRRNCT